MAEKGGYKHFMLKEIFEQPRAVRDTMLGRVGQESGKIFTGEMDIAQRGAGVASSTSRSSPAARAGTPALAGKFMIEQLARLPVEVDYGSEFRYRDPILDGAGRSPSLISQSGETADTLAAQREVKQKGGKTIAICNVIGSMLTREADGTLMTHAGPEIGVASTKAFTAQLTALFLLAMRLAQVRGKLDEETSQESGAGDAADAGQARDHALGRRAVRGAGAAPVPAPGTFCSSGRGIHYPIALEGALKLKEISYIHAEGYPAGEMKHGPNALIDENLPVVVLATHDDSEDGLLRYEKTLSNIQEVKAREGIVVAVACEGDNEVAKHGGPRPLGPAGQRTAAADSRDRAAAVARLSCRRAARLRRRPAAEPRQERHGRMRQATERLSIATRGKGLYEFTGEVERWLRGQQIATGLLTVWVKHTSASLTVQENADPDVVRRSQRLLRAASRPTTRASTATPSKVPTTCPPIFAARSP